MEKHLKYKPEPCNVLDLQAVHSSQVATTTYSRSTTDPYYMSRDDLFKYFMCSQEWHHLLGASSSATGVSADISVPSVPRTQNEGVVPLESKAPHVHSLTSFALSEHRMVSSFRHQAVTIAAAQARLTPRHFMSAQQLLKRFLNDPLAKFKSTEQCIGATLVLEQVVNLLVVLPTNAGKSLFYQLAAFSDPDRVVIVVIPLVALLMESVEKCKARGIHCAAYNPSMSPHTDLFSLVFVSVEFLSQPGFGVYMHTIHESGLLSQIFFDEAHVTLTAHSYRPCIDSVVLLSPLRVQKVLMTATLPCAWEKDLESRFGFPFATLRRSTTRPEISYVVEVVRIIKDMQVRCISLVRDNMHFPDKGIVFVMTKNEVHKIAASLEEATGQQIAYYHSDLTKEERMAQVDKWRSNRATFIVATSGFGQGVDYPHVRMVIHYGLSHNMIDFAQETGRAGRDGKRAVCITIYCRLYSSKVLGYLSHTGKQDVEELD
jgi:superfamily II DNA helicase RecQ